MQFFFKNDFKDLTLQRYPIKRNQLLQAWDASDEYLLSYLHENRQLVNDKKIIIFNETFGALALALHQHQPTISVDSFIAKQSLLFNASENNINQQQLNVLDSLHSFSQTFDLVIIKTPKTLDYLRHFLSTIAPHIHNNTQFIVAGMIKLMPSSLWKTLEHYIGQTTTSLAKKKARLIFVKTEKKPPKTKFPKTFIQEGTSFSIFNHANVFSKDSMDIGTRFLLKNLPKFNNIESIIDLGCGNGIVGLNLAIQYPEAHITFTDESYMAVASAQLSMQAQFSDLSHYSFVTNNCLDGHPRASADLIVCNPPFHQSHTIGTHIAEQMFVQSFKTLKIGGYLIVVANRHLPYFKTLKRIFGSVQNIASNKKFYVLSMRKNN